MIAVSTAFKTAIKAPSRTTHAKVIFQIVDVTASSDATITVSSESVISRKDQVKDTITGMSGKYATMETNYWKMDGTFAYTPKVTDVGYQVGWWSNNLSLADNTYTSNPVITVQFTSDHSSIGLTINFDDETGECASDFTIDVYNSSNSIIYTTNVTGNTLSKYILEHNLSNYRKIIVTITKWSNPYRRVRMSEISFGIVEVYDDNTLINMSVLEDLSTISANITSNELKFTIENQDKRFNILNPSGVYPYLQRKQKLLSYLGVEKADLSTEYVSMGIFYLNEWKSDEGTLTATFTARDVLDLMSQSIYRKSIYQARTLYNLAVDVLTDAGVTDYTIDSSLSAITTTSCLDLISHRDALQQIAIAGKCVVYADRDGKVIIKPLGSTPISGEIIDFDNVYSSPQIKLDKLINTIDVLINNFVAKGSSENVYSGSAVINGTVNVWIEYKTKPCQSVTALVSGGTLNNATYYANAALLNITAAGTATITATGTVLEKSASLYELVSGSKLADEPNLAVKVDNNLITTTTIASNVATWLLTEYEKRYLYDVNFRGDPSYEQGDIIEVENDFGVSRNMMITKQDFQYTGYLSCKVGGKA